MTSKEFRSAFARSGGKARAAQLTAAQRSEIAASAAHKRWGRPRKKKAA